jgi:hypothetical protein
MKERSLLNTAWSGLLIHGTTTEDELCLFSDLPETRSTVSRANTNTALLRESINVKNFVLVTKESLNVRHLVQAPDLDCAVLGA